MKRSLFTLLLIFLILPGFGQVSSVVNEGFESWPATGWSTYTFGAGNGWIQSWQNPSIAAHTGAHSANPSINNSPVNNWLVSPPIDINTAIHELNFWERFDDILYYGSSVVHISTGSPDPTSGDYTVLFTNTDTSTVWVNRIISLSSYQGDTVYIAFQYTGTWHLWFVDDVFVGPLSFIDAEITGLTNPTGTSTQPSIENVIVNVRNNGTDPIDTLDINWTVNGASQSPYASQSLNLAPGADVNLTLGSYNFNAPGSYNIQAVVNTPGDSNPPNDSLDANYGISSEKDGLLDRIYPEGMHAQTGNRVVQVLLKNVGAEIIDTASVNWTVNGVAQTQYSGIGLNILPGEDKLITIGQYNFPTGVHEIFASAYILGDTATANNSYLAYAAVDTFWESFEGREFPPVDWSVNFGLRDDINFGTPPHGNYYYSTMPDSNYFGAVADTIWTPMLDIVAGDSLKLRLQTSSFMLATHHLVWKDSQGQVQVGQVINSVLDNWDKVTIDLTPAAGVHSIGISSVSMGPGFSKMDLFTSTAKLHVNSFDLSVEDYDIYFLAGKGQNQSYTARVKNRSDSPVSGSSYSVKLMDNSGALIATASGTTLGPWDEATISVQHSFPSIGAQRVYLQIDYAQDEDLSNNQSLGTDVHVVPAGYVLDEVGQPDRWNLNFPFTSSGSMQTLGEDDLSQTLYPASDIPDAGNIYGFYYRYDNMMSPDWVQRIPLKVWIYQTQLQDLSGGWVPANQLTLVFDDTVEVLPGYGHSMYIPFDNPLSYVALDNIVVQVYAYDASWPPSILRFYSSNQPAGSPTKTLSILDVFALDPINPPLPNEFEDFASTVFVIEPILDTGLVQGYVYDTAGVVLAGATVSVEGTSISAQSDINGFYALPYLPQNSYPVTASLLGYNDEKLAVVIDSSLVIQDFYLIERAQVTLTGTVYGDNAPGTPLEYVKVIARGYTVDSTGSNAAGQFALTNIFGISDYELTLSLYGYRDTVILVAVTDSSIGLGSIFLQQEHLPPFDVAVSDAGSHTELSWKSPFVGAKEKLQNDFDVMSFSYTNSPMEDVWLGNRFEISDTTTLTSVEFRTDVYELTPDAITIDVFDHNEELLLSSEVFLIYKDSIHSIDIPNIVVYDDIYVMLHWQNNLESTNALAIDWSDSTILNSAVYKYPGDSIKLFTDLFGGGDPPNMSFLVRVNTYDDDSPETNDEVLSYEVFRGFANEFPDLSNWDLITSLPVTGSTMSDTTWTSGDSSGIYRYAVRTVYVGGNSPVTFSNEIVWERITTGILNPTDFNGRFDLYPVPASEYFNLDFEYEQRTAVTMAIHSAFGQLVLVRNLGTADRFSIRQSVDHLPDGIYFVSLDLGGQVITKKIIVSKN